MLEPEDIAAVHLGVMKPVGIAADEMQAGTTELGRLFSDRFGKRLDILRIERRAGIGHDEHETPREVLYPSARGCRSNEPYRRPCWPIQRPTSGSPSTAPADRFGGPVDGSRGPFRGPRCLRMLHPLTARRGGG